MKSQNVIDGLTIIQKYHGGDCWMVGADHDVIYAYAPDKPISKEDVEKMIELGWHQEYDGRDYNEDFSFAHYMEGETWRAYV